MGYRHYVGYIEKDRLPAVMKEVDRLKLLIGTPREDDEDETYDMHDITEYLQEQAFVVHECGKLYWDDTDDIRNLLYKDKAEDYSNEDTEFFFINNSNILFDLSFVMQKKFVRFLKDKREKLEKLMNKEEVIKISEWAEVADLVELIKQEERAVEVAEKLQLKNHPHPPYTPYYQYNYAAAKLFNKFESMNTEDKVFCVFAY